MCKNPFISFKLNDKIMPFQKLKYLNENNYKFRKSNEIVEIKCGKCLECLKEKRREMITRLKDELKIRKNGYFITLTYDEQHKRNLNKRDIQLFLKRLRKKEKIRYFYVGELGEKTERPHYHMIIFGNLPEDLKEEKNPTKNGYKQYNSKSIQKIWQNGLIRINKLELPIMAYITKYMMKNTGNEDFIQGWSKNPPIGINEETIEEDIKKPHRTKCLKKYYKYRFGEIPIDENDKERNELKIKKIESETKLRYYDYLTKKV